MLTALVQVVLPVVVVAGAGAAYDAWRGFPIRSSTDFILHASGACLVFHALSTAPRFRLEVARLPVSVVLIVVACLAIVWLVRRLPVGLGDTSFPALAMPAAFMNAANMGLPVARLAFGDEGFAYQTVCFVTFSILHYSLGVSVVAGRGGWVEMFRLPLIYAAVAGVAANQFGWTPPRAVGLPLELIGQTVIPFMLLSLGARVHQVLRTTSTRHLPWPAISTAIAIRLGGGLLIASAVNVLLGNEGLIARVTLLVGVLPPAVMNFALVEKFGSSAQDAAAVSMAIAVGTLVALPLIAAVVS